MGIHDLDWVTLKISRKILERLKFDWKRTAGTSSSIINPFSFIVLKKNKIVNKILLKNILKKYNLTKTLKNKSHG